MTAHLGLTCPQCRGYDNFSARQLEKHEGFLKLAGATIYICNECGFTFMPEDEFASDWPQESPLAWSNEEDAVNNLLLIQRREPMSVYEQPTIQAGNDKRQAHEAVASRLVAADPEGAGSINFVETASYMALEFRRLTVLSKLNSAVPTYYVDVYALARLWHAQEDANFPSYEVRYRVIPDYGKDSDCHSEPLFWLSTRQEKAFIRLATAPYQFFEDGVSALSRYWSKMAEDDEKWTAQY